MDILNLNNKKENKNSSMEDLRKEIVENAKNMVEAKKGNNYVWGAKGPNNFDCSGLSKHVYNKAGVYIPDGSKFQATYAGKNPDLKKGELKEGDLVFFGKNGVSHVAIYIGNGMIIDSGGRNSRGGSGKACTLNNPCEGVRVKPLNYRSDFRGGLSVEKIMEKNKTDSKGKITIKKGLDSSEKTLSINSEIKPDSVKNEKRIEKCLEYIFSVEGGYSNHPNDKGGATRYGIIESEARRHGYKGDMEKFPKDKAKDIYIKDYYYKNNIDKITDDRVALSIFDWSVNSGGSKKQIQKVLNEKYGFNLAVDGIIGKNTLKAINSVNSDSLLKDIKKAQLGYYDYLVQKDPKNKSFHEGWYNRVEKKEKFINQNFSKASENETGKNLSEKINEVGNSISKETKVPKKAGNNVKVR